MNKKQKTEARAPNEGKIEVRASSLPAIASCARYYAAQVYGKEVSQAHPDIMEKVEERGGGYKSTMGDAMHKIMHLNLSHEDEVHKAADEAFERKIEKPGFFDEKFLNTSDLKDTLVKMVLNCRQSEAVREWTTEREGNIYEKQWEIDDLDPDYILTGHIDCVRKDGMVLDLKIGVTTDQQLYQEQLTAYHMMVERQGRESPEIATIVKIARPKTPNFKETTLRVVRYEIPITIHKKSIPILVKKAGDVKSNYDNFKEDFTKLPANPACRACQWCKLKNTSGCPETQSRIIE